MTSTEIVLMVLVFVFLFSLIIVPIIYQYRVESSKDKYIVKLKKFRRDCNKLLRVINRAIYNRYYDITFGTERIDKDERITRDKDTVE